MSETSGTRVSAAGGDDEAGPQFAEVCSEDDLADGEKLAVEIDGQRVLIARVQGRFYAIGAVCTHERAFLDEGMLADCVVYCPLHYSAFDVRDGSVQGPPADRPSPTFATKVVAGTVSVSVAPADPLPGEGAAGDGGGEQEQDELVATWPPASAPSPHERLLHRVSDTRAMDRAAQSLGAAAAPVRRRLAPTKLLDLMHGTWSGHALHPALSDLPIGLWIGAFLLFLVGQPQAALLLSVVGTVSGLAAAVTGLNDLTVADGHDRRVGVLHGLLMTVALLIEAGAGAAAWVTATVLATVLTGVGLVVTVAAAYLGGHLVLARGAMVNHAVAPSTTSGWHRAVERSSLTPGTSQVADIAGGSVLLYEDHDGHISAIENACSHAGGPLSLGPVCDGIVSCPWHDSRFRLRDGALLQGPATFGQPVLETRQVGEWLEVRRVPQV